MHEVSLSGQHTNTYSDTVISELMHHTDGLNGVGQGKRWKLVLDINHVMGNG